ncbi:FkbM family methyltransferase [Crocosphaera sp. UHCC 0190]|uniref:FkbM family methyltransferase n=1 Tax=Crocosphaera sp. UHCC 0190 TaxID=3110246 RepID=UPI002B20ECE7|nr:FkbM family methyltransferase [Crocosphaera sp. UHCC 0190]MEA5511314.1 FkbM family methyltransferase [Crocosphaera sp. UHCC 0190]
MQFSEETLLATYPFKSSNPFLVDVGAHQGTVSTLFAKKGWQVLAFEPEAKNRAVFEQKLKRFEQVTCIPKAVSNIGGEKVPFYVSNEHYGIHSLKPWHDTHQLAYEVDTVRLDDALAEQQISSVTLLKIDIEGADFFALKGFDFQNYFPELVMTEFMDERTQPNFSYTHHDVALYMKERGYTTFISEWQAIKEYGREGVKTDPHVWIQCLPYPLDHQPAWGNLIFVPDGEQEKFQVTLDTYLKELRQLQKAQKITQLRQNIKNIPGVQRLYNFIKGR